MLRGCAGIAVLGHHRGRREHLDAGLAHGHHVRAGADHLEEPDEVLDVVVEAEAAGVGLTSRALCQSVM